MTARRNLATLVFVAILFWIAAPTLECLAGTGMAAERDCCAVMQGCDATMASSCCQLAPKNDASALGSEFSPEHDQHPGLIGQTQCPPLLADSEASQRSDLLIAPRELSPGHGSVLRI